MLLAPRGACTSSSRRTAYSDELQNLAGLQLAGGSLFFQEGEQRVELHPVLLGEEQGGRCKYALDVSSSEPLVDSGLGSFKELRSLMPLLPPEELAVAGHAVSITQWHKNHVFCGKCGEPTQPIEAGGKRQCVKDHTHREYPRTDPVVIMMVESPDGSQALLGRSKKVRAGMYTCLAGFVEQAESIEEAVRREVREEAGIELGRVSILGSQPWPIGRGGSCELMIGCVAQATSDALSMDPDEMDDVRWIAKADVRKAVETSGQPDNPYLGGRSTTPDGIDFWIPPPFAIAHHLIKAWAEKEEPWFSRL
ncbi:hypothetical protein WJX72_006176 [[Myrmecia] bisecta]|uniref:NAD(+) diphosphatase n=1 Tax=[Myrmecia] bisecta TaxID=41462 RepID=A0AAW1P4N7_9CHLO